MGQPHVTVSRLEDESFERTSLWGEIPEMIRSFHSSVECGGELLPLVRSLQTSR